jgi:hypothetical protein
MTQPRREAARDDRPRDTQDRKIRFDAPHPPIPVPRSPLLGPDPRRPRE